MNEPVLALQAVVIPVCQEPAKAHWWTELAWRASGTDGGFKKGSIMSKQEAAGGGRDVPVPGATGLATGPRAAHYALAVAAVAGATLIRWLLDPVLVDRFPFLACFLAVLLVAWVTSLWPSIVTLVLGVLAGAFFFVPPRFSLWVNVNDAEVVTDFVRYLIVGTAIIGVCEAMRRARLRAEAHPELLRVTLASIGDGVLTTDVRGNVDFLNPVAEALTGWTREEAAGRSLTEVFYIVNQETRAQVENPALRAVREGTIVGLANHTILIARAGTERHIADSAAPIRSKDGQIVGGVLVFRDVTALQEAEVELRRKEGRFRLAAQVAGLAVAEIDYATGQVHLSPESAALFGLPPQQLVVSRATIHSMFHPDDRPDLEKLIAASYDPAGTGEFAMDHRIIRPDGQVRWHSVRKQVFFQNQQRTRSLLAMFDITERKQAEQALKDSEVRFRRLFESAKDGVLMMNAQTGKITDANAFMSELTGVGKDELIGKELHEIGMYKDVEENKAAFRDLQQTGYLRHDHLPVHNRRGERVEVEFVANVYKEGEKLVVQCNVRDISERIRLQQQVVKQAAVLAEQAKGLADQASVLAVQARSKDEFLAMLSHELRNPLAPIRAAAHMMRLQEGGAGASANPMLQQAREIIERQVANLTKMVSDLSEVSRVISGRIRLDLRPVDMKQVVEHAVQSVTPLFEQRDHAVTVSSCSEPVWAHADATRLEEVLVNLLNNAAKYTPDGGRIAVACELRHEGEKNYAMARVRDNGVGIEESLLPRVFDLFTQGERSLDRSWGGLGIGLSLAHRLMTMHGGTIEAHSAGPGKGSEFIVKLPLLAAPRGQVASEGQSLSAGASGPMVTGEGRVKAPALRVLVVDDNIDLVTMLCGTLRLKGFVVQCAYTGPEGLRIAREWRPDIALLDIGLPGLDGYEIARRLRSENVFAVAAAGEGVVGNGGVATGGTGARMKLIAITGYGREDDVAHAREAGFDGHLVKPCDMEKLEEMMAAPAEG